MDSKCLNGSDLDVRALSVWHRTPRSFCRYSQLFGVFVKDLKQLTSFSRVSFFGVRSGKDAWAGVSDCHPSFKCRLTPDVLQQTPHLKSAAAGSRRGRADLLWLALRGLGMLIDILPSIRTNKEVKFLLLITGKA